MALLLASPRWHRPWVTCPNTASDDPNRSAQSRQLQGQGSHGPSSRSKTRGTRPCFLQVKGLVKQHIDSYNYFVDHVSRTSSRPTRKSPPISTPSSTSSTRHHRWRAAQIRRAMHCNDPSRRTSVDFETSPTRRIFVNIEYTRGNKIIRRKNVAIGRIPSCFAATSVFCRTSRRRSSPR